MDNNTLPDIDGLLSGIRTPTAPVGRQRVVPTGQIPVSAESDTPLYTASESSIPDERIWHTFMTHLSGYGFREKKDERKVCMLDKDLADSLDECDIDRKCRSDVINAIVRTFVQTFLPKLREYRKINKSLLDK